MSADADIDGVPILSGDLDITLSWPWTLDCTLDGDPPPVGRHVTLNLLGFPRAGTVITSENPDGRTVVRVVAGAARLNKVLKARDYVGTRLDHVVGDTLTDAGEVVGDLSQLATTELKHWSRAAEPAGRALRRLMRVGPTGCVLQAGQGGSLSVFVPDWAVEWRPESGELAKKLTSNAAALVFVDDLRGGLVPGKSIVLYGTTYLIERVQYFMERKLRAMLSFRVLDDQGTGVG